MDTKLPVAAGLTASIDAGDEVGRIILEGRLDRDGEAALSDAYIAATGSDPSTVEIDFSRVNYINSTGIALIVELLAQVRKAKKELVVFGLSDHYVEIFEITRLADFMTIYESEARAMAA